MNDDELRIPDGEDAELGRELGRALRPLFAAPGDLYWSTLERRIMARVAEERAAWWTLLAGWMRPAAIAAALVLTAAGVVLTRTSDAEASMVYMAISEEPHPVRELTAQGALPDPAATLQPLFDH